MTRISLGRVLVFAGFVTSLIPYLWTLGIIALAVRARFYLGRWPRPSHPDPKNLPFELHHEILWTIFHGVKWSVVIAPVLYFTTRLCFNSESYSVRRDSLLFFKAYLIGWLIILSMIFVPYIDFVMWFLD